MHNFVELGIFSNHTFLVHDERTYFLAKQSEKNMLNAQKEMV